MWETDSLTKQRACILDHQPPTSSEMEMNDNTTNRLRSRLLYLLI